MPRREIERTESQFVYELLEECDEDGSDVVAADRRAETSRRERIVGAVAEERDERCGDERTGGRGDSNRRRK